MPHASGQMMTLRLSVWLCVLLALPLWARGAATDSISASGRALVLVYARSLDASAVGQGFIIGDGTLVITVRHILYGQRPGDHRPDVMVEVVSPYLGDACEAQLVSEDRSLDLAVL